MFRDVVSYSWSGAALEAGGVTITTHDTQEIGDLPIAALPVDVTFETYSSFDDQRIFNRPMLGLAAVDPYGITYMAEDQTLTGDHWTAVVEYRYPRGTALLSIARDLSLILLGGAVSLFLIPQAYTRAPQSAPAQAEARPTPAEPLVARPSEQRLQSEKPPPHPARTAWAGALALAVALIALRRHRTVAKPAARDAGPQDARQAGQAVP